MSQHPVLPSTTLRGAHAHYLEQLSDQDFWKYAEQLAQTPPVATTQTEEYLECDFESGLALLPLTTLREVLPAARYLAQLPTSPHWMLGITAWRGESIAVIDLATYLTQQPAYPTGHSVLLIAQLADVTLGLSATIRNMNMVLIDEQEQASQPAHEERWQPPRSFVLDTYAGVPILHIPNIVTAIVQQLRVSYE
ncbi:chemotaxis protein CheW [Dictyobacter kobayashii]|uniref:CheW-like domain-containing protein n=1 Tax=Dictyobacter kobayashii TaxID=2014872 RepID=A0A402AIG0_9CHLR|nr:chemotaxis protein CheW [Dictyobacter kobayashii]GCE18911.1 hypothetical protein KDK_27110 [Dictyobacter kobayashii]